MGPGLAADSEPEPGAAAGPGPGLGLGLGLGAAAITGERFLANPRRAIALAAIPLGIFALAIVMVANPASRAWVQSTIDVPWREWMLAARVTPGVWISLILDVVGASIWPYVIFVIITIVLLSQRRWRVALVFVTTIVLASGVNDFVWKRLIGRVRPPDHYITIDSRSFPSGHAVLAGFAAVAVVLMFTQPGPRRRLWWLLTTIVIVTMAWSRTYLSVHWLSDVVAGAAWGVAVAFIVFGIAGAKARPADVGDSGHTTCGVTRPRGRGGPRVRAGWRLAAGGGRLAAPRRGRLATGGAHAGQQA